MSLFDGGTMSIAFKVANKLKQKIISFFDIANIVHMDKLNTVSILTYHCVTSEALRVNDFCFVTASDFEEQISYLNNVFDIIPMSDMYIEKKCDKPRAIITFDDGFYNNYEVAFPILKKYKSPFSIYLSTNLVKSNDTVWFCKVNYALSFTQVDNVEWNGKGFNLTTPTGREEASIYIQRDLKIFKNNEIEAKICKLYMSLNLEMPANFSNYKNYRMLDQQAIDEMRSSGLVEYGAHTHNHTILSRLSYSESYEEISKSIYIVTELTGQKCKMFAYPNGGKSDFSIDHINIIKELGIVSAVTMESGLARSNDNPFKIKRLFVSSNTSLKTFKLQVHGFRN